MRDCPRPCPMSSRLESCRLRVSESRTTQVLSVSIDSSTASVSAGTSSCAIRERSRLPVPIHRALTVSRKPASDPPSGPMTSALPRTASNDASAKLNRKYVSTPAPRPRIAAGTRLVRRGARSMTAAVTVPTAIPVQFQAPGYTSACKRGTPFSTPSSFGIWLRMMISPTPLR